MKLIKRVWKNLKWLFNHPPTHVTTISPPDTKCDYCGTTSEGGLYNFVGYFTICYGCMHEAFDKILKPEE